MKLPNLEQAIIPQTKVTGYLLSEIHEDGRHKAAFFISFGFRPENWQELAGALRRHVADHEIAHEEPSPFGRRFVVEGIMHMPDGRTPWVRSIWFQRTGETAPRFVTAYPLKPRLEE